MGFYHTYILRTAEGFENCSKNGGRVGYLPQQLIKNSLLENESRCIVLYNEALPKFYTHERSWCRGQGGKMYAHGDFFFFFFFFFLRFDPHFPPFSLSLSLFPSLFLWISYAWQSEQRLIGVALRSYNGKPKNLTFFLLWKPFRALPLHVRELVFILLLPRILPY